MLQTTTKGEIFVLDDDAATRQTLSAALQEEGYDVICFLDGASLLSAARACVPACIFLEVSIPRKSGLHVLKKLRAENYNVPVFVISGRADIPTAVDAIRSGALEFIEKPFISTDIIPLVRQAIGTPPLREDDNSNKLPVQFSGCKSLTRREQEVLTLVATGASNKEAARQLRLSTRTIEDHRANIMKKAGVRNAAELIRQIYSEGRRS